VSSIPGRYPDIALATGDFAKDIQQALDLVQNRSPIEPVQASALNREIVKKLKCFQTRIQNEISHVLM
jgi:hypothetical protein